MTCQKQSERGIIFITFGLKKKIYQLQYKICCRKQNFIFQIFILKFSGLIPVCIMYVYVAELKAGDMICSREIESYIVSRGRWKKAELSIDFFKGCHSQSKAQSLPSGFDVK